MSGTRYYSSSGGALAGRAGNLTQNLGAMGGILREFASAMTEMQGAVLREVVAGLRETGLPQPSLRHARSCGFPESAACDPDLGALVRDAYRGETVRMPVRFRNTTGKRRTFQVSLADTFRDSQGRVAKSPSVEPQTLNLDDGEIGQVVVSSVVDDSFAMGSAYSGRLFIRAEECEDQYLTVTIRVSCEEGPVIRLCCPCDTKVRPLRWYHHYYCDPPARTPPGQGTVARPVG